MAVLEKSAPTREQFMALRRRYEVIGKGLELLKSKREALMKEFFGIVDESIRMREELNNLLADAQRRVERARAIDGASIESFAHASKRSVPLSIKARNIWGIFIPEIDEVSLTRSLEARDISPLGERAEVLDAAKEFEAATELIVKIASREIRLTRIGEVIRSDSRKINAISEVILPSIKDRIKYIERVLEEREREEIFRLKRNKAKRQAGEGS
ncbi:MAG: V-type ATP synthase subunit D [Thermodesulfobacteriota bacterium]|nr:MAG: V-type ATP synthase subunit D [Thermodesulfobacteriota bacterium]